MKMETFRADPAMIRYLLRIGGMTVADVARSLPSAGRSEGCLSHATVTSVINGRGRSRRIENRIAALTGQPLHVLWPQWYGPGDKPIKKRRRHTSTADVYARLQALQAHPPKEAA